MITTIDLYKLIKSLSKVEKNYFKSRSKKLYPKETQYLILFNLLDNLETFSKEEFDLLTKKNKLKNIGYLKNYLTNILFDELLSFRRKSNPAEKINELVSRAIILRDLGSTKSFFKIVNKAYKIAEKFGLYGFMIRISDQKIAALNHEAKSKSNLKKIDELIQNKIIINQYTKDALKIKQLSYNSENFIQNEFRLRDKEHREKALNYIKELEEFKTHKEFLVAFYFNTYKGTIYNALGKDTSNYSLKTIELFQKNKHFKERDLHNYVRTVYNHIETLIRYNHVEKTHTFEKELKNIKAHSIKKDLKPILLTLEEMFVSKDYIYHYYQDNVIAVENILPKFEKMYLDREDREIWLIKVLNKLPFLYFKTGNYAKSLEWLNKSLSISIQKYNDRKIYSNLKILEIMLHFELGNYLILKNLSETSQKFLKRQNDYFETEQIMFSLFNSNVFQNNTTTKLIPKFKETHTKIVLLYSKNEFERTETKILNFSHWLASKF